MYTQLGDSPISDNAKSFQGQNLNPLNGAKAFLGKVFTQILPKKMETLCTKISNLFSNKDTISISWPKNRGSTDNPTKQASIDNTNSNQLLAILEETHKETPIVNKTSVLQETPIVNKPSVLEQTPEAKIQTVVAEIPKELKLNVPKDIKPEEIAKTSQQEKLVIPSNARSPFVIGNRPQMADVNSIDSLRSAEKANPPQRPKVEYSNSIMLLQGVLDIKDTPLKSKPLPPNPKDYQNSPSLYKAEIKNHEFRLGLYQTEKEAQETLSEAKKEFMAKAMEDHPNLQKRLFVQNQTNMPIKAGVEALRNNYEKWNKNLGGKELINLQQLITLQHENLNHLSEIMDEVHQEMPAASFHLDMMEMKQTDDGKWESVPRQLAQDLNTYIRGEKPITPELRERIKDKIVYAAEQEIESKIQDRPSLVQKNKKDVNLRQGMIQGQSKAFQAARLAQAALKEGLLTKVGGSANEVFRAKMPPSQVQNTKNQETVTPQAGTTVGYFKQADGGEATSGKMEKLVWNLAGLLGQETSFAGTKETTLSDVTGTNLTGGVQFAQEGVSLHEHLNANRGITRDKLGVGTLATIVFGMFDAHNGNMIIDPQGNIKFFDNTRSLPGSNGVILWGGYYLMPTFRSGLLAFPDSYKTFEPGEREQLKQQIADYRTKFKENRDNNLFDQPIEGWLNPQESYAAMDERLTRLENAIDDTTHVNSLRDLTMAVNPEFKFAQALHCMKYIAENRVFNLPKDKLEYEKIEAEINKSQLPYDQLIEGVVKAGINPQEIKKLCEDPNNSFEDILKKSIAIMNNNRGDFLLESEAKVGGENMLRDLYNMAKIDTKDIIRTEIPMKYLEGTLLKLRSNGIPFLRIDSSIDQNNIYNKLMSEDVVVAFTLTPSTTMKLYYKSPVNGLIESIDLDIMSKPGMIAVKGTNRFIHPKDIKQFVPIK